MTGFVYIWLDRKRNKFYIGSHWGSETDGYICSSKWMNAAYKKRPHDFKRRIIAIKSCQIELRREEKRWLSFIKEHELKTKYYNQNKNVTDYSKIKITNPERKKIATENRRKAQIKKWESGVFRNFNNLAKYSASKEAVEFRKKQGPKNSILMKQWYSDPANRERHRKSCRPPAISKEILIEAQQKRRNNENDKLIEKFPFSLFQEICEKNKFQVKLISNETGLSRVRVIFLFDHYNIPRRTNKYLAQPWAGKHWWNNGTVQKASINKPGDGWERGRLKLKINSSLEGRI